MYIICQTVVPRTYLNLFYSDKTNVYVKDSERCCSAFPKKNFDVFQHIFCTPHFGNMYNKTARPEN